MRALASVLIFTAALALTSCDVVYEGWGSAYQHQGRDPKPKKYVPIVRDFGGLNGRETWLYSPAQLEPPPP
jgi:hypothetical protein